MDDDLRVDDDVDAVALAGELAGDVAADGDLRVDHDVDAAPVVGQLVRHGVHKEGHVVGDHLDDEVAGGPAVPLSVGVRTHMFGVPRRPCPLLVLFWAPRSVAGR